MHLTPVKIDVNVPTDSEIRIFAGGLTNGRARGALGMRAEHIKAWLRGGLEEEDPVSQGNFVGNGDNWKLFAELLQAVWAHGIISRQMLWSIGALIPKGGGDYRGIGLLEPIWKVLERIMDCRLNAIIGGPVQVFPPIYFLGARDLIFRRAKTPKKTDRRRTKGGRFFDTMRIIPPIVAILRLISSSAGRSIVKSATVSACTIQLYMH